MSRNAKKNPITLSVIIPVYNESENIRILREQIGQSLESTDFQYEVIWVDDASTDDTVDQISMHGNGDLLVRHTRNRGQSSAIMSGFNSSNGILVATLDGDLQNDPNDLPMMINLVEKGFDVVCGVRRKRKDTFLRKTLSGIANRIARIVTGVTISDLGCTLRVFRREALEEITLMGEMHRVLGIYFYLANWRIIEVDVNHRERIFGQSKYGYSRVIKFILDLVLAVFYMKFREKPLYFFGRFSMFAFAMGCLFQLLAFTLFILGERNFIDTTLVVSGVILQVCAALFIALGLQSELALRNFKKD